MADCTPRRHRRQIETLRAQFAQPDGLAFADVLPADRVQDALREEGARWRHKVYTPLVTLWAFLSQVASPAAAAAPPSPASAPGWAGDACNKRQRKSLAQVTLTRTHTGLSPSEDAGLARSAE